MNSAFKYYQGRVPACGIFCGGCSFYTRLKSTCSGASTRCAERKCGFYNSKINSNPMFHIHPATVADIPELAELYKNTILSVNRKDYSVEEVEDWASCGNDTVNLRQSFAEQHYIIAKNEEDKIVGFASVSSTGYIHTLFVHKDFQHQGIAILLYNALEKYAKEKGARKLTSEVSITARPFFEKQGFIVDEEQKRKANKLYLINYKMSKHLIAEK